MVTRRRLFTGLAAVAAASGRQGRVGGASRDRLIDGDRHARPPRAAERPAVPAGRDAERLDAPLAHARRRQGISSGGRTRGARDRARHEGAPLGLQRPVARARPSRSSKATGCASSSPTACPEATSIHWHGQRLPNGMDGVSGLNQPAIKPGQTFVYEFVAQRAGTFMYHPHADEMTQMAMGMMGFWVTHPADPRAMPVDRDYVFLLNAYDIDPGSFTPQGEHHAGFQSVDLQQPRLSRHRSDGRRGRASACASASAI